MAPTAAVPPAIFAVRDPRDSLSRCTLCVLMSTIFPFTLTETRSRVSSARPVSLPDSLESTNFTTTSDPRGMTGLPFCITGSSRLAAKVCPTRAISESTPSIILTTRLVPAGIS